MDPIRGPVTKTVALIALAFWLGFGFSVGRVVAIELALRFIDGAAP